MNRPAALVRRLKAAMAHRLVTVGRRLEMGVDGVSSGALDPRKLIYLYGDDRLRYAFLAVTDEEPQRRSVDGVERLVSDDVREQPSEGAPGPADDDQRRHQPFAQLAAELGAEPLGCGRPRRWSKRVGEQ